MIRAAVIGGIGSGKTFVANLFKCPVFNADDEVKKMINHDGPYLLEVMIEKEENVFPMIPSGSSVSDIRLE